MTKKLEKLDWVTLGGIAITLALVLLGELFRLKGFLLVDFWVPTFVAGILIWKWARHELKPLPHAVWPAALFVALGFASLLLHSADMSWAEFIKAALYGARWAGLFLLSIVAMQLNTRSRQASLWMVFVLAGALALAGIIQLQIMPDMSEALIEAGWDPHKGRLFSTWLDPNFLGAFLAFSLCLMTAHFLDKKSWRLPLSPLIVLALVALALTLSRSSYLALLTGLTLIAFVRARWLIPLMIAVALLGFTASSTVQNRAAQLLDSARNAFTQESFIRPDPSARERFDKWQEGWLLFTDEPFLGQGFNRYSDAGLELGTIKDPRIHYSTGNDSSALHVLALTGVLGFIPWLLLHLLLLKTAWQSRSKPEALGFFAGLCGLLVHSIFVNSLFMPFVLIPFWLAAPLHQERPALSSSRNAASRKP